jgi:nucleotide-binding universal stress UspA family protein
MDWEFKTILMPTDFSKFSRQALKLSASMAAKYDAQVTIMHVIPEVPKEIAVATGMDLDAQLRSGPSAFGVPTKDKVKKAENVKMETSNAARQAQEAVRDQVRSMCSDLSKQFPLCPLSEENIIVRFGNPVEHIVDVAATGEFDLIIMGTRGHGKIADLMVGSVANEVIRRSSIPVMVAKISSSER